MSSPVNPNPQEESFYDKAEKYADEINAAMFRTMLCHELFGNNESKTNYEILEAVHELKLKRERACEKIAELKEIKLKEAL